MINILLTGTAGFIGSNFVPYFLKKNPEYNLINLVLLTYAGNLDNLKECEKLVAISNPLSFPQT